MPGPGIQEVGELIEFLSVCIFATTFPFVPLLAKSDKATKPLLQISIFFGNAGLKDSKPGVILDECICECSLIAADHTIAQDWRTLALSWLTCVVGRLPSFRRRSGWVVLQPPTLQYRGDWGELSGRF